MISALTLSIFLSLLTLTAIGDTKQLIKQLHGGQKKVGLAFFYTINATILALALFLSIYFITHGSWNLIGKEMLSTAYDSLGQSLLSGHVNVDPKHIRWEAFKVNGLSYMYFGPLPAVPRMLLNSLFPTLIGHWARMSCLAAIVLNHLAFLLLLNFAIQKTADQIGHNQYVRSLSLIGFTLGSPILLLSVASSIYHEAALWGLACALLGLYCAFSYSRSANSSTGWLFLLSFAAGSALLCRVLFGAPLFFVILIFGCSKLVKSLRDSETKIYPTLIHICLGTSPALIALVIQLCYNKARFNSYFIFIDFQYLRYIADTPNTWEHLQTWGNFNLYRVPSGWLNYFGLKANLSNYFPFITVRHPVYLAPDLYPKQFNEYVVSLTITSPWLLLGALYGLITSLTSKAHRQISWIVCMFVIQFILILSYFIVTYRYSADLLPFLVGMYIIHICTLRETHQLKFSALFHRFVLSVLVFTSVWCTFASTISWIPKHNHIKAKEFKLEINKFLQATPKRKIQRDGRSMQKGAFKITQD